MLEAAARLFGTQRFHEVRMEDIAAEAGVGKGTIYRYFKDKEELYLALLTLASEQILERLEQATESAGGPAEKLKVVVREIIAYFDEHPHLFDLIHHAEAWKGPNFPWQEARNAMIRLVKGLFQEGADRNEFTVTDPELGTLMLLGGVRAVIRFGPHPRPQDLADRLVRSFLHGAAGPSANPANHHSLLAQAYSDC